MSFFKNAEQESMNRFCLGIWKQWKGAGYKERVYEDECGGTIMYSWMKMEK
jgi:hypothetical protein